MVLRNLTYKSTAMKTETNLDKFNKIISKEHSGWLDDAKWREENEAWLDHSFKIALRVLSTLRNVPMTQKELAEKMGVSPQHINKIVKGQENLSLETIAKIESALGIELISISSAQSLTEVSYDFEKAYEISEEYRKKMFAAVSTSEYGLLKVDSYEYSTEEEPQKIAA